MKKVYIAGALSSPDAGQYLKNCHTMLIHAEQVRKAGFAVFVPCLDFIMGMMFGDWEYKDYFDNSQPFLESCDFMYVCPDSEESKGTLEEMKTADRLGIPVVFDLPTLIQLREAQEDGSIVKVKF